MAILKNTSINSSSPLQLPSGTTAQRPASPAAGSMRFNTDLGIVEIFLYNGWVDAANGAEAPVAAYGQGGTTILYIPMYGDSASNQDVTDQISGTVGTAAGGTISRNYLQSGYNGFYVSGGGYLDIRPPQFEYGATTLNGRRYWTVEWWCWNFGTGTGGGTQTMLEMNNYPHGILYRGAGASVDHYWRGSPISWGNVTTGVWCHYALVGYGTTIKSFNNGTQVADTMNAVASSQFADPYLQGTSALRIGASNHTASTGQHTNGVYRKFRISLGARYLTAFTPSTAYPL